MSTMFCRLSARMESAFARIDLACGRTVAMFACMDLATLYMLHSNPAWMHIAIQHKRTKNTKQARRIVSWLIVPQIQIGLDTFLGFGSGYSLSVSLLACIDRRTQLLFLLGHDSFALIDQVCRGIGQIAASFLQVVAAFL